MSEHDLIFVFENESTEEYIDPFDKTKVRQKLMSIEREYNRTKEQFYYRAQSYFHQSIGSNYTDVDNLKKLLNDCETLKKMYIQYKEFATNTLGTKLII